MNRGELVTSIRNKLGYNTGLDAAIITAAIDEAQDVLEEAAELPWFLESGFVDLVTVAGDEKVAVPSDFIRELNKNSLWLYDISSTTPIYTELGKSDMIALRNIYGAEAGSPEAYALQGGYFRIFPTPDAVYDIRLIYYGKQPKLTADLDTNAWSINAPQLLLGYAGMLVSENSRDKDAYSLFSRTYETAARRVFMLSEAREHAGQVYQRGGVD